MQFLCFGELLRGLFLLSKLRIQPSKTVVRVGLCRVQLHESMFQGGNSFLVLVFWSGINAT